MTDFGDLPLEIILNIADQANVEDLYPWALVGKQFYARTNPNLWRQPPLRSNDAIRQINHVLKDAPHLAELIRVIDIGNFAPRNPEFTTMLNMIPHLEELNIQHGGLLSIDSVTIPRLCPHLTSLSLENTHLTTFFITALTQQCQHLHQLHLLYCTGLSCRVFSMLATLPLLEELSISVSDPIYYTGTDIRTWWRRHQQQQEEEEQQQQQHDETQRRKNMVLDLARLDRLTRLTIHHPPSWLAPFIAETLTDGVGNPSWPHLTHLYLENCHNLGDASIIGFIESHRLLESIVLVNGKFTNATLDAMVRCLSGVLAHVALPNSYGITHAGVRRLVLGCPLLELVHLMGCHILRYHFPEAGAQCLDGNSFLKLYINYLDLDAINRIQQGDLDQNIDDDDDDDSNHRFLIFATDDDDYDVVEDEEMNDPTDTTDDDDDDDGYDWYHFYFM